LPESEYEREEREKEELLAEVDAYLEEHPFSTPNTCKRIAPKNALQEKNSAGKQKCVNVAGENLAPESLKPFVRRRKREVNLERGIAQIAGWLSTIEAWRRNYAADRASDEQDIEEDISATLHF